MPFLPEYVYTRAESPPPEKQGERPGLRLCTGPHTLNPIVSASSPVCVYVYTRFVYHARFHLLRAFRPIRVLFSVHTRICQPLHLLYAHAKKKARQNAPRVRERVFPATQFFLCLCAHRVHLRTTRSIPYNLATLISEYRVCRSIRGSVDHTTDTSCFMLYAWTRGGLTATVCGASIIIRFAFSLPLCVVSRERL